MTAPRWARKTGFNLRANRRQRDAHDALPEADDEPGLKSAAIAGHVAVWEREWATTAIPESTDRQTRSHSNVPHNHRPRVAAAGRSGDDARTGTIRTWVTPALEGRAENEGQELPRRHTLGGRADTADRDAR